MILLNEQNLSPAARLHLNQIGRRQHRVSEAGKTISSPKKRIRNSVFFFESHDIPFFAAGADGQEFNPV